MIRLPDARIATPSQGFRVPNPGPSGIAQIGQAALQVGQDIQRQEDAERIADVNLTAAQRLQETRLAYEQDTDYTTLAARQAEDHQTIRQELAATLPEHQRQGFERTFQQSALGHEAAITRRAGTLRTQDGRARLTSNLDDYFNLAAEGDDATRLSSATMLGTSLQDAIAAGYVTGTEAEALARRHVQKLDKLDAERLYNDNPAELAERLKAGAFQNLDPLAREQLESRATRAAERRTEIERNEIEDELVLIEAARSQGSEAENEEEVLARALSAGMGETAMRAVRRGRLLSTIPEMSRSDRQQLLSRLRGEQVAEKQDVQLLKALADLERDEIKAERKAIEKQAKEEAARLEKESKETRKELNKLVSDHLSALGGDNPAPLANSEQVRVIAHALGRGDEWERAAEIYGLRQSVGSVSPQEAAERRANLAPPEDLATLRAQQRLEKEIEEREAEIKQDPIAAATATGQYGVAKPDFEDPAALRSYAVTAEKISRDYIGPSDRPVYFSNEMRAEFTSRWDEANADQKAGLIQNTFIGMNDPTRADAMLRELEIANPMQRTASLYLLKTGNERLFLEAFRGQERLDGKLEQLPSFAIRKTAASEILGKTLGPNVTTETGILKLADALYAARAQGMPQGDTDSQQELYKTVLLEAAGGQKVELGDSETLLPIGMDQDHADLALERLTHSPRRLGYQAEAVGGSVPVDPGQKSISAMGAGGAPSFGGAPIPREYFSDARFSLAGDGLYQVELPTADGEWFLVERDDQPGEPWLFDVNKAVSP